MRGQRSAWVGQDRKQLQKYGADTAKWFSYWNDLEGHRKCKCHDAGKDGKKAAEKHARKIAAELVAGVYKGEQRKSWVDFKAKYEKNVLNAIENEGSRREMRTVLNHFERIVKPKKMADVNNLAIDSYKAARKTERGRNADSLLELSTLNKELRYLKTIFNKAVDWEFLRQTPKIKREREADREQKSVSENDFDSMYLACRIATDPIDRTYSAAEWWQALLMTLCMTGMRIGAVRALRWEDVNLEKGWLLSRAKHNKSKRDEWKPLHPKLIDHLEAIRGLTMTGTVFDLGFGFCTWRRRFVEIQRKAKIELPCDKKHKHTESCQLYGWHAFRHGFTDENLKDGCSTVQVQAMLGHASLSTTERYIKKSRRLEGVVEKLHVPAVVRTVAAAVS